MEFIQYIGAKTEGEGAKKKKKEAHIRMENKISESIISQAWEA